MNIGPLNTKRPSSGLTMRSFFAIVVFLLLLGWIQSESLDQFWDYTLILCAAILPAVLWIRLGTSGIPIFPAVCLAYIPYFAWPVLSLDRSMRAYDLSEIHRSAMTVMLFLLVATAAWRLVVRRTRGVNASISDPADQAGVIRLILVGIFAGVLFHAGIITGWVSWFGSFFGLLRSVVLTLVTVSFFLAGVSRAQGFLRDDSWVAAVAGMGLIIVMSWSSLFLVSGMLFGLAAAFGYISVTKRVPWASVAAILALVWVLHAGKSEMRNKYWSQSYAGESVSVLDLPGFTAEWFETGLNAIVTGETGQNLLDRASLMRLLLMAQRMTPTDIDYLNGETYALLPSILVPRFINPEKPDSQVGLTLLNIRYGVQTRESAALTTIGWGLLPEAFANFGYFGVIGMALLLGFFCAGLERWSVDTKILSIPMLASIANIMVMINLEADFINISLALIQSFLSVVIFTVLYRKFFIATLRGKSA